MVPSYYPAQIIDRKMTQPRRIRLVRPAHVYYTHRNIDKARQFLDDFGFKKVASGDNGKKTYYRGTGSETFVYCAIEGDEDAFGGAAFVVESMDDLTYAAEHLPNVTPVTEMVDEPGGGFRVTFLDPVDKFPFHLVFGQEPAASGGTKTLPELDFNFVGPHL